MKILYITTYLLRNESASIRNISLINGLIENDCNVDVITLDFLDSLEDNFLKENISQKVKIIKIPIPNFNKIFSLVQKSKQKMDTKNGKTKLLSLKNFIKKILYFPDVYSESIKNIKKIDVKLEEYDYIISSSDSKSSHFLAKKLLEIVDKVELPWIQIWGDPWEDDIGLKELNFLLKYRIRKNEKILLEKANKIFYLSPLTAKKMSEKLQTISNKIYTLSRSYLKTINTINKENSYIFSYTGTIENRNIKNLVKSIENYNKKNIKKIKLNFYGINEKDNKQEILNKNFIKIYNRVSFKEILEVYKKSDVLVYIDNLHNSTQIPGKIYDYFGTNKVILGLYEEEETKSFLEKFNRIELVENKKEFDLENIIKKINTKDVLEEFSPKKIAEKFLKDIEKNGKMKIGIIFGTRPEAIKIASIYKELKNSNIEVKAIVTGQHKEMLYQVLDLFDIKPDYDLKIMKQGQGLSELTGNLIIRLDKILKEEKFDYILVQGDTTSALTGALVAFYNKIPVGHIEAGLRTGNIYSPFPEEANRKLIGSITDIHFAPTDKNVKNLLKENYSKKNILKVGNTVIDALFWIKQNKFKNIKNIKAKYNVENKKYILLTLHRRENWGKPMENIFEAIRDYLETNKELYLVFPMHLNPIVREIAYNKLENFDRKILLEPLDYLDFIAILDGAYYVMTDSGGIQEEAPSLGKPTLVLRDTTERPEAIEAGTAKLVGTEYNKIIEYMTLLEGDLYEQMSQSINPYGDGKSSKRIKNYFQNISK